MGMISRVRGRIRSDSFSKISPNSEDKIANIGKFCDYIFFSSLKKTMKLALFVCLFPVALLSRAITSRLNPTIMTQVLIIGF